MQNENPPPQTQTQNRTVNDVLGVGEAIKSIFAFFTKIVDKLPFTKITPAQTQFILVIVIINLISTVLLLLDKISEYAFYVILLFDCIMAWKMFDLTKAKS